MGRPSTFNNQPTLMLEKKMDPRGHFSISPREKLREVVAQGTTNNSGVEGKRNKLKFEVGPDAKIRGRNAEGNVTFTSSIEPASAQELKDLVEYLNKGFPTAGRNGSGSSKFWPPEDETGKKDFSSRAEVGKHQEKN
jgi:hypothetical protein